MHHCPTNRSRRQNGTLIPGWNFGTHVAEGWCQLRGSGPGVPQRSVCGTTEPTLAGATIAPRRRDPRDRSEARPGCGAVGSRAYTIRSGRRCRPCLCQIPGPLCQGTGGGAVPVARSVHAGEPDHEAPINEPCARAVVGGVDYRPPAGVWGHWGQSARLYVRRTWRSWPISASMWGTNTITSPCIRR